MVGLLVVYYTSIPNIYLYTDYFFLEEISRSTTTASRSRNELGPSNRPPHSKKRRVLPSNVTSMVNPHISSDWLNRFSKTCQLLVEHAANRGVSLTLLAPGMSKRLRNTSYMDVKHSVLYWRVEWQFPSADDTLPHLFVERAGDFQTPMELLDQYLTQRPVRVHI